MIFDVRKIMQTRFLIFANQIGYFSLYPLQEKMQSIKNGIKKENIYQNCRGKKYFIKSGEFMLTMCINSII